MPLQMDPDIEGRDLFRVNPRRPVLRFHFFQHLYFFIILLGYGFSVVYHSFITILEGAYMTPISPL